jgi:ankyrin repeat protein
VVKELLNNGAYVHADYYTGVSPLVSAAKHRHMDVVKLLLDHGANLCEIIRDTEVIKQLRLYKTAIGETRANHAETARKVL